MTSVVLTTISLNEMAGGLEKNISLLANYFSESGRPVHLITFDNENAKSFYSLHPNIQWHKLGRTPPHSPIGFRERLKLIFRIRAVLKKLDRSILITFHHGVFPRIYAASMFLKVVRVVSERNSITLYRHIKAPKWSLGFISLFLAKKITVQFPAYIKDYPNYLRGRIFVIPNPVFPASYFSKPDLPSSSGRYCLLSVGRICAQKNQDLLINAFMQIHEQFPEWDLHFVGDGEKRDQLLEQVKESNLSNRIFFHGNRLDVSSWYAKSHLFCMPSSWEGFPNALAEAMAHGLPCIGLSDCSGVKDLIVDGITGSLVKSCDLSAVLSKYMESPAARVQAGKRAVESVSAYHPDKSFDGWRVVLRELGF